MSHPDSIEVYLVISRWGSFGEFSAVEYAGFMIGVFRSSPNSLGDGDVMYRATHARH